MAIFDNIPGWKVFSTGIGIAALVVVGYFSYKWFIAGPDDLKTLQHQAAENALDQVAEIYENKVRLFGEQRVVVMPVDGDTSEGQIRHMLIRRLNRIEGVRADVPRSPGLEQRAGSILRSLIGREDAPPDATGVFEDAAEADEVISVRVEQLWSGADSGVCTLDVYRISREDTAERKPRIEEPKRIRGLSGTAVEGGEPVATGPGFWVKAGGFLWRLLVVLAATAALPFLAWPAARPLLKQDSNALNAALLFGLTAVNILVLFATVGFAFSAWPIVFASLLLPVALLYNYRVLSIIESM